MLQLINGQKNLYNTFARIISACGWVVVSDKCTFGIPFDYKWDSITVIIITDRKHYTDAGKYQHRRYSSPNSPTLYAANSSYGHQHSRGGCSRPDSPDVLDDMEIEPVPGRGTSYLPEMKTYLKFIEG